MHSHIAIVGDSGELALSPDTSLTITDKNPMFNDVEMFSQPIALPFRLNRHLLGNMDDVNSSMRASDVDRERFRIIVDGLPLRTAVLKTQDGTVMRDTIDVNFDATNRTFKDMIADMRCRDVEIDDDILIGEKIGNVEVNISYTETYDIWVEGGSYSGQSAYKVKMKPISMKETFQPMALGFSYPAGCNQNATTLEANPETENSASKVRTYKNPNKDANGNITVKVPSVKESYINVSHPYGDQTKSPHKSKNGATIGWPYCNSRICYPHYAAKQEDGKNTGETSDDVVKAKDRDTSVTEDKSPYWVLPADRPASGLCFYVGYFLEKLFKHLGVAFDMTVLTNIVDFNYLTFFSSQCHYDTREISGYPELQTEDAINKWLESRGCGGKMNLIDNKPDEENFWTNGKRDLRLGASEYASIEKTNSFGMYDRYMSLTQSDGSIIVSLTIGADGRYRHPDQGGALSYNNIFRSYDVTHTMTAKVLRMYANSDNFPDASVTEVIESLENSFGVRFCYDAEINKVTVKLLRDMFRDQQAPIHLNGTVLSMNKVTENIRGVRVGYSAESDAQEQRDNIRYGKRDYDTNYDYMDYSQERTKLASYADVTEKIDVGNRNGYCDLLTGDFFRIKVSADASTTDELQPAVFEVGQFRGVEVGDCSKEAEDDDAIKEIISQFEPIIVNDVDYRGKNYDAVEHTPMLVPFIDEEMEHEFLIKKLLNPVSVKWGSIDIVYELCLAECYDPSSTDDGQSPLQTHDWGLTIGILRPTAGDGTGGPVEYDQNYDGFGNARWLLQSANYAITADSYDVFGNFLGTNPAGSFALKPCAYKPFRYKMDGSTLRISTDPKEWEQDPTWLIPCNDDERNAQGVITARRRSRGMYDTFLKELVYFLLYRQKYEVKALCTAAELADIPNKWLRRWEIDGKIGYLNLLEYPASVQDGIGEVRIEFYAI